MGKVNQSSVTIDALLAQQWSARILTDCDKVDSAWYAHWTAEARSKWWIWQRWFLRREPTPQELHKAIVTEHWITRYTHFTREAAETLQLLARNATDGNTITVTAALIKELERALPYPQSPRLP